MNKLHAGVFLVISSLVFSAAQADIILQDCNGCSSAQVEALAPICGSAKGYAYVSDLVSQNLYKVCYTLDINDEFNPPRRVKEFQWATPESNAYQTWKAYENIYLNNGHREAADVSVKIDIPSATNLHGDNGHMNAYDTIGATPNNDAVIHFLNSHYFTSSNVDGVNAPISPAFAAAAAELFNKLQVSTPVLTLNPNFPIVVVVVFNDGSKRTYSFSYTNQTYQATPGTARDGHGQLIPENTNMASNGGSTETYDHSRAGPNYDQQNLQNLLNQFGAKIVNGGGGFTTCSWRSDTSTLTCTIHPY
jgi:hypothetical protein